MFISTVKWLKYLIAEGFCNFVLLLSCPNLRLMRDYMRDITLILSSLSSPYSLINSKSLLGNLQSLLDIYENNNALSSIKRLELHLLTDKSHVAFIGILILSTTISILHVGPHHPFCWVRIRFGKHTSTCPFHSNVQTQEKWKNKFVSYIFGSVV